MDQGQTGLVQLFPAGVCSLRNLLENQWGHQGCCRGEEIPRKALLSSAELPKQIQKREKTSFCSAPGKALGVGHPQRVPVEDLELWDETFCVDIKP